MGTVRICDVCGKRVLVSKAGYTESRGPETISPRGVIGVPWIAHNVCLSSVLRHAQWLRLLEACDGNEEQARRVLGLLP